MSEAPPAHCEKPVARSAIRRRYSRIVATIAGAGAFFIVASVALFVDDHPLGAASKCFTPRWFKPRPHGGVAAPLGVKIDTEALERRWRQRRLDAFYTTLTWNARHAAITLPPFLVGIAAYSLTRRATDRGQGRLRCLKCGHILKGLTEPRCPECGERI